MSNATPSSMLEEILTAVDRHPTLAAHRDAARQLDGLPATALRPLRVALLASFTLDGLVPYLRVEAARRGFAATVHVAPFNNVQQELLNAESGSARFQPDLLFVCQRLAELQPALADDFLGLSEAAVSQAAEAAVADSLASLAAWRQRSGAPILLANFTLPPTPALGIVEAATERSQTAVIREINGRLAATARQVAGCHLLDLDRLSAEVGYQQWSDPKLWHLARAPIAAPGLLALARRLSAYLSAAFTAPRKCLVLDLDNTLWGGVLGEVGWQGIQLGGPYPGSVYREFQQTVLGLYRRGILLALNSKNNRAEVDEALASHPDMVLRPEHFAAIRANWEAKPGNMTSIAQELNIGLDSLVFFDDSPMECALMRSALPEILTIQAPGDPLQSSATLLGTAAFERLTFTDEDRRRGQLYREQQARHATAHSARSLDDFLGGLDMRAEIRPVDTFSFPRALDLLHKTNQFNATTRRYTAAELQAMVADPANVACTLRLMDRFGDSGIVGLAILRCATDTATIDTFLLSCRVIGRSVETAFLAHLFEAARRRGAGRVEGLFMRTAKNAPAADLFARHGFTLVADDGRESRWVSATDDAAVSWPACIAAVPEPAGDRR